MFQSILKLGRERGKLGPVTLARMQLKSKMDRLMALK
jgi:hypothetical protein